MFVINGIPILAAILEPVIGITMIFNSFLIYKKYRERKSRATGYLTLAILSFGVGALISGIGKILGIVSGIPESELNISGFTIVIAYIFTALANIFIVAFLVQIFKDGDSKSTLVLATLNGMTIGFLLPNISFAVDVYQSVLYFLIWHILISLYGYGNLTYHGFKEANLTDQKIPKTGFKLIAWFGISANMLFVLFVIDLVVGTIRGYGFTVFYYMAWASGAVASILAYLFMMPTWFKNRIS